MFKIEAWVQGSWCFIDSKVSLSDAQLYANSYTKETKTGTRIVKISDGKVVWESD